MKKMRNSVVVAAMLFSLADCSFAAAEDKKPSKGTEVGQTINDAITAALPGTKLIFDALKPFLPSGDKKKSDIDTAMQNAAEKARQAAISASNAQLARLSGVLTEITITNQLGDKARLASTNLTVIRSRLANQMADVGWDQLKDEWNKIAKRSVVEVVGFEEKKLDQITDRDVHKELTILKRNSDRDVADFERLIDAKNQNGALTSLFQIIERLDDLAAAPSVQLSSFGAQLAILAEEGTTPMRPSPPPPVPGQRPTPPELSPLARLLRDTNSKSK